MTTFKDWMELKEDDPDDYVAITPGDQVGTHWCYRLYLGLSTGDGQEIGQAKVDEWLGACPDLLLHGYTLIPTRGRWQGGSEQSMVLEVIGLHAIRPLINAIATSYARTFDQDEVWITADPIVFTVIKRKEQK